MKKLDTIFSQYIRLRDTNDLGHGRCFTCGVPIEYKTCECGHFRHRRHINTRWHEFNAHAQCFECNRGDDMVKYIVAMLNKYDSDIVDGIIRLSNDSTKLTKAEMEELYLYYHDKIKELLKDKMFKI